MTLTLALSPGGHRGGRKWGPAPEAQCGRALTHLEVAAGPSCLNTEITMSRGVRWVGEGRLSLARPFQKLLAMTPPLGGDAHATLGSHLHADSF